MDTITGVHSPFTGCYTARRHHNWTRSVTVQTRSDIGDYGLLRDSFRRSLRAQNKAPSTVATYLAAVDELGKYLADSGMPQHVDGLHREHIEHWIASLLAKYRPATVSVRYRAVQQFF